MTATSTRVPGGTPPRYSAWSLVAQAIWFGMITGYSEVLVLMYRLLVGGAFINQSRDFVWHAPLAYSTMFLAGVPVMLLLQKLPSRWVRSIAADPEEAVNLIDGATGSQIARDMRQSLEAKVATALPGTVPVELQSNR